MKEDLFRTIDCFMNKNNLPWIICVVICTDGAHSMVGSTKGFTALAKKENENIITVHCFLHREALVHRSLELSELRAVMGKVVQMDLSNQNYFHSFMKKWGQNITLLIHREVRWLSRGLSTLSCIPIEGYDS